MKTNYPDLQDINVNCISAEQKAKVRKYAKECLSESQLNALKIFKEHLRDIRIKKKPFYLPKEKGSENGKDSASC